MSAPIWCLLFEMGKQKKCGLNYPILEIEVFDYLCTHIYGIKPTP